ncbi:topoisomerase DNA-binding C4 zinc finger domain-containing protein [Thiotrichales bacterium 19S11-10]|nr:topoisomerase DNA-binding C4 zinc finger domain-containing protein [Thiotrichales bacterium 19S11-10]
MTISTTQNCPKCQTGKLKKRSGKFGQFLGCSKYPDCCYTLTVGNSLKNDNRTNSIEWVNASSIAEADFCIQSFYLKSVGMKPNSQAVAQMKRGNIEHKIVSQGRPHYQDDRCYISSYAFGSNHPITIGLRYWRDHKLLPHWYGRFFIRFYYIVSPLIIKLFGNSNIFKRISKRMIKSFAKWIMVIS